MGVPPVARAPLLAQPARERRHHLVVGPGGEQGPERDRGQALVAHVTRVPAAREERPAGGEARLVERVGDDRAHPRVGLGRLVQGTGEEQLSGRREIAGVTMHPIQVGGDQQLGQRRIAPPTLVREDHRRQRIARVIGADHLAGRRSRSSYEPLSLRPADHSSARLAHPLRVHLPLQVASELAQHVVSHIDFRGACGGEREQGVRGEIGIRHRQRRPHPIAPVIGRQAADLGHSRLGRRCDPLRIPARHDDLVGELVGHRKPDQPRVELLQALVRIVEQIADRILEPADGARRKFDLGRRKSRIALEIELDRHHRQRFRRHQSPVVRVGDRDRGLDDREREGDRIPRRRLLALGSLAALSDRRELDLRRAGRDRGHREAHPLVLPGLDRDLRRAGFGGEARPHERHLGSNLKFALGAIGEHRAHFERVADPGDPGHDRFHDERASDRERRLAVPHPIPAIARNRHRPEGGQVVRQADAGLDHAILAGAEIGNEGGGRGEQSPEAAAFAAATARRSGLLFLRRRLHHVQRLGRVHHPEALRSIEELEWIGGLGPEEMQHRFVDQEERDLGVGRGAVALPGHGHPHLHRIAGAGAGRRRDPHRQFAPDRLHRQVRIADRDFRLAAPERVVGRRARAGARSHAPAPPRRTGSAPPPRPAES